MVPATAYTSPHPRPVLTAVYLPSHAHNRKIASEPYCVYSCICVSRVCCVLLLVPSGWTRTAAPLRARPCTSGHARRTPTRLLACCVLGRGVGSVVAARSVCEREPCIRSDLRLFVTYSQILRSWGRRAATLQTPLYSCVQTVEWSGPAEHGDGDAARETATPPY